MRRHLASKRLVIAFTLASCTAQKARLTAAVRSLGARLAARTTGKAGPKTSGTDLGAANRAWIIAAFDRRDGVGDVRRQAVPRGFAFYERAVGLVRWFLGLHGLPQSRRSHFGLSFVLDRIIRCCRSWNRHGRTA